MEEYSYTCTHPLGHTGPVTGTLYLFSIMHGTCTIGFVGGGGGVAGIETIFSHVHKIAKSDY